MTATLYKSLDPGGRCRNGGSGSWHLPRGSRPGEWMPRVSDPVACVRGYHVCTSVQLLDWLGPEIWIVETRGAVDHAPDKSAWEQARIVRPTYWCDRVAQHFAADCAEMVLPIFEAACPGDDRPRLAIQAARDFADGKIGRDAARAAARAAWTAEWTARDAAWRAAWTAAWTAEWAARDAAWAARDAARTAADAADAADATTRRKQAARLRSYLTGARGRALVEGGTQ